MRIKQKPEDFVVREAYSIEESRHGKHYVYLMDKQKLSTFEAIQRISARFRIPQSAFSFCGLKDKQGRTEQIIAILGTKVDMQDPDLRLRYITRTNKPLSTANLTANRFAVTVRDLSVDETTRVRDSVREVRKSGIINYFDSQRFGGVKHGQGFLAKDLAAGRIEHALKGYMAKPSGLDRSEDAKVKSFWEKNWGNWNARCPYPRAAHYRPILMKLKRDPGNWVKAFESIEPRYRALIVFEYQSYLWNEAVRKYLLDLFGRDGHLLMRYQAGQHFFPRNTEGIDLSILKNRSFPLPGPDLVFEDPKIEAAIRKTLIREKISLEQLALPDMPHMGMKHEDRQLVVIPPKLSVVDPRPDEMHPGRLKVTLAFTLPSGAYATLLVRRIMWFASTDTIGKTGPLPAETENFIPPKTLEQVKRAADKSRLRRNRMARPSHGMAIEANPDFTFSESGSAASGKNTEKPKRRRNERKTDRRDRPAKNRKNRISQSDRNQIEVSESGKRKEPEKKQSPTGKPASKKKKHRKGSRPAKTEQSGKQASDSTLEKRASLKTKHIKKTPKSVKIKKSAVSSGHSRRKS